MNYVPSTKGFASIFESMTLYSCCMYMYYITVQTVEPMVHPCFLTILLEYLPSTFQETVLVRTNHWENRPGCPKHTSVPYSELPGGVRAQFLYCVNPLRKSDHY